MDRLAIFMDAKNRFILESYFLYSQALRVLALIPCIALSFGDFYKPLAAVLVL